MNFNTLFYLLKVKIFYALLFVSASIFAQQSIKVDFDWKPSKKCNIKNPSISLSNIPTGSTSLVISLVDMYEHSLDHGESFTKSKTVLPEKMTIDVSLKSKDKKCPPNFLVQGHSYEITVIAKDDTNNVLGKGSAVRLFPNQIINDHLFTELFNEAKKLIQYKENIKLPEMYPTTVEHLESLICQGAIYCPISAVYFKNIVYYKHDLTLSDPVTKSILVHEFIHHIQVNKGSIATDCKIWYKNELEAYKLQARYLRSNYQDDSFIDGAIEIIKCPP